MYVNSCNSTNDFYIRHVQFSDNRIKYLNVFFLVAENCILHPLRCRENREKSGRILYDYRQVSTFNAKSTAVIVRNEGLL